MVLIYTVASESGFTTISDQVLGALVHLLVLVFGFAGDRSASVFILISNFSYERYFMTYKKAVIQNVLYYKKPKYKKLRHTMPKNIRNI